MIVGGGVAIKCHAVPHVSNDLNKPNLRFNLKYLRRFDDDRYDVDDIVFLRIVQGCDSCKIVSTEALEADEQGPEDEDRDCLARAKFCKLTASSGLRCHHRLC